MQTVLFHSTIFGPIQSRRLGTSLGINLSPNDGKICSFDCLYCEAGLNSQGTGETGFPEISTVIKDLETKLIEMKENRQHLDVITFSGNGEPTLHPRFPEIIDEVIKIRNRYYPDAAISVLTNSSRIHRPEIIDALKKVDNSILKLDSAVTSTMRMIDRPNDPNLTSEKIIESLKEFGNKAIVQTMLLTGEYNDKKIDNTTPEEVEALIDAMKIINPQSIMLYSIDRPTPITTLRKVSRETIEKIAEEFRANGFTVSVA